MSKKIEDSKIEAVKTESVDLSSFKDELESLRAELIKLREDKKSFSNAEKAAIEEARDEMITDDELGVLYIPEKYKQEGYHTRVVDSTRPGRVASLIKRGYEIVYDDEKIGDKTVTNTGSLTGAMTVELGTTKACLGILMRCPLEHYNKRQKHKAKRIREDDASMFQDAANKSDFGSIQVGEEVYKK
jgi:hypothetical protein